MKLAGTFFLIIFLLKSLFSVLRRKAYNKEWVNSGNREYTVSTNLPPDDYFKTKVSGKTSAKASFMISIVVPYGQQWWFILLLIGVLLAFIYGLHRYRIYQLLQVQKVKNRISAHLHDDLGARLTNIQILTVLSKKRLGSGSEEIKYLEKIEEEVNASAKALDEIVWNIKLKDENLEEILAKIRSYAADVLESEYEYRIEINGKIGKKKLSMQKRRELFLVFKELLNNIKKHAKATEVEILVSIEDKALMMTVKDNGIGFNPGEESPRNGLRNIKERVRSWNGFIHVQSGKNKGTFINLRIPFDSRFSLI